MFSRFFSFLLFFCVFSTFAFSVELLRVEGHLNGKTVEALEAQLNAWEENAPETLLLSLHSISGELKASLSLARTLYEFRSRHQTRLLIYLDDQVLGPAALLPFLADELYTSLLVSWGAIPLGAEEEYPTNLLRSRVRALIAAKDPLQEIKRLVAEAMVDPERLVVEENGWQFVDTLEGRSEQVISGSEETLIIDQGQLQTLGLVKDLLTQEELKQRFHLAEEKKGEDATKEEKKLFAEYIRTGHDQTIGRIYIGGHDQAINTATWIYVRSALKRFRELRPTMILLELDSPGGEVFAAQQIADALRDMDVQEGIPVVAYINNWAISAGAMLAYSCRYIIVAPDASMGAAEPVFAGGTGQMQSAPEKINSALRADFANRARYYGRDPLLAEAMVDQDLLLVWRHGEVIQLQNSDQLRLSGPFPDKVIIQKEKLLTLNSEQLLSYGVANLVVAPTAVAPLTVAEEETGQWSASKSPVFHQPFFEQLADATIVNYQWDWRTLFFSYLSSPAVSSLLFMAMMIGFYMEISTPGFGIPGAVGLSCLFLIGLSSFSTDAVHWLEIIMVCVGIILMAVEIFIIPGFGVIGVLGILLTIGGLFALMLPSWKGIEFAWDTQTFNAAGEFFIERLTWLSGSFVLSVLFILLLTRYLTPRWAFMNRLVLKGEQESQQGYVAGVDPRTMPAVGTRGVTLSPLRPSGKVRVDDEVYDAMSQGAFIAAHTAVEIIGIESTRVVVTSMEEK